MTKVESEDKTGFLDFRENVTRTVKNYNSFEPDTKEYYLLTKKGNKVIVRVNRASDIDFLYKRFGFICRYQLIRIDFPHTERAKFTIDTGFTVVNFARLITNKNFKTLEEAFDFVMSDIDSIK